MNQSLVLLHKVKCRVVRDDFLNLHVVRNLDDFDLIPEFDLAAVRMPAPSDDCLRTRLCPAKAVLVQV